MYQGRGAGTTTLHAVLMAALVVATAFVVGVVVFDLEGDVLPSDAPPDASFQFVHDAEADTLEVTHYGGDSLDADRVRIVDQGFEPIGNFSTGPRISAGESTTLAAVDEDDSVYVLWVTDDGDYSTLASWNPNPSSSEPTGTEHATAVGDSIETESETVAVATTGPEAATTARQDVDRVHAMQRPVVRVDERERVARARPVGESPGSASTATFLLRIE